MTSLSQVNELEALGVNYAGFIFYKGSPRFLGNKIAAGELKNFNKNILKVGVFVNGGYQKILQTVQDYGLDVVQLHGDEPPAFCKLLAAETKVVKAFRLVGDENIEEMVKNYEDVVDMFLFDTKTKKFGGSGKKFDWDVLNNKISTKPFFLSGGMGPGDEPAILNFSSSRRMKDSCYIDLNSKFEIAPGIKDMQVLKKFIENLKA